MKQYFVDTIDWLFPQATSQAQFIGGAKDFGSAGGNLYEAATDTGYLVYDSAAAGGKILILGVVAPTVTIAGAQDFQKGLALASYATSSYPNVYTAVNQASVKLATGLTFVAINPLLAPALGFGVGMILSYEELLDAGYRIVHAPFELLKGAKNTVTGFNKCAIGSLISLKEYLGPSTQALSEEELGIITFDDDPELDPDAQQEAKVITFKMKDFEDDTNDTSKILNKEIEEENDNNGDLTLVSGTGLQEDGQIQVNTMGEVPT